MNYLGNIILNSSGEARPKTGAGLTFLLVILGLFLVGMGIAMFLNPNLLGPPQETFDYAVPYILLVVGGLIAPFGIIMQLKRIKSHSALIDVYESGIEIKKGKGRKEQVLRYHFDDLKGIQDEYSYGKYGIKIRGLEIATNRGEKYSYTTGMLANLYKVADALTAAHTAFVMRNANGGLDALKRLKIGFSHNHKIDLLLQKGIIFFSNGNKEIKANIADLIGIETDTAFNKYNFYFFDEHKQPQKLFSIATRLCLNIHILNHIISEKNRGQK